jgi:hypothetical protein
LKELLLVRLEALRLRRTLVLDGWSSGFLGGSRHGILSHD